MAKKKEVKLSERIIKERGKKQFRITMDDPANSVQIPTKKLYTYDEAIKLQAELKPKYIWCAIVVHYNKAFTHWETVETYEHRMKW